MDKTQKDASGLGANNDFKFDDEEEDENGLSNDKSKDFSDDEKDSDSDFMENMEKLVYLEDLDQKYKLGDINIVGKLRALGKDQQEVLKERDYFTEDEVGEEKIVPKKTYNKFLEKQQ